LVNQQGRYVLVVDSENIARVRPIVIGQAVGLMWAVESGLKADELVIVEGIQKVKPDAPVQISPSGAQES
jgi:membrane fusion protein (multidrug efflux system)